MKRLARAQKAVEDARERRSAAAHRVANIAWESNAQIRALDAELNAAELALVFAERELAQAEAVEVEGFLATSSGRASVGRLYGLR